MKENDDVHALVAYFDCEFTCCHKPVYFSTGPADRYTHWKQTVFYLENTITARAGEVIVGELSCKPNDKNPRDLDIAIRYQFQGEHSSVSGEQFYRMC